MSIIEIFISYSHKDEALREELEKHLTILKRQRLITYWHDHKITAGAEWSREIKTHLTTAQIILLLISPDFMASHYCYSIEMKHAMERHERGEARVIPIILRPVYWREAPFSKLQALPLNGKPSTQWTSKYGRDKAFVEVTVGIREAIKGFERQWPSKSRAADEFQDVRDS